MATTGLSVADVMTTDPVVIYFGASLEAADIVLRTTFIKGIPVVDDRGKLVGTISHAQLAAHRFAELDGVRPDTGSTPTARTEESD